MARITVEDCLKRVPNRFVLVNVAAKRVRQIREGAEYLVNSPKNEDIVVSLREIAAGKIKIKESSSEDEVPAIEAAATEETETPKAIEEAKPDEPPAEVDEEKTE